MNKHHSLEEQIGDLLQRKNLKLTLAESCTGGLISHRITNISGSSDYFLGGLVSYSYEAKETWLGVGWEILEKYGAVSRETVLEMARGARKSLIRYFPIETVVGLSVSGIAGPSGGIPGKPVGLVWIGLSGSREENAWQYQWKGSRAENKAQSAQAGLQILLDYLNNV